MKYFKSTFLAGIMVAGVLLFFGCSKQKPVSNSQLLDEPQILQPNSDSQIQEADSLLAQLEKGNPFCPDHASTYTPKDSGRESNKLKGIIWDAKDPYALIGDKIVVEGDYVGNKKVIKINKDSILLDNDGQVEVIALERSP